MKRNTSQRVNYVGEKIGYLDVVEYIERDDSNGKEIREYRCKCSACGNYVTMPARTLTIAKSHMVAEGKMPSCGCKKYSGFMERRKDTSVDLTDKYFARLHVLEKSGVITVGRDNKKRRTWKCQCDCGNIVYVTTGDLISQNTKSCGCLISEFENQTERELKSRNIEYRKQYSFPDLLSDKNNPLRFDFAILDKDRPLCLIECQGQQHYVNRDISFGRVQREVTDKQKKIYCENNNIPLFEIAYFDNINTKVDEIVSEIYGDTVPSRCHKASEGVTTIPKRKYTTGETPAWKCLAPTIVGEEIVYSPKKYRETEGIKVKRSICLTTARHSSIWSGRNSPQKCGLKGIRSSCIPATASTRWLRAAA